MDPGHIPVHPQEAIRQKDTDMGFCCYVRTGGSSVVAPLGLTGDSFIFPGEGAHWNIVCLVGLPSLCHWLLNRMAVNQVNNKTLRR